MLEFNVFFWGGVVVVAAATFGIKSGAQSPAVALVSGAVGLSAVLAISSIAGGYGIRMIDAYLADVVVGGALSNIIRWGIVVNIILAILIACAYAAGLVPSRRT